MTCGVAPTRRIPRPALFQRAPVRQATRPAPTGGDCGVAEEGTGAICAMPEVLKASEAPGVALVVSMVAEFKRAGATEQRYEDLLRLEQAGGLMSYSPDRSELWRRGAGYVDRVLTGAKSADLVVQEPNEIRPGGQSQDGHSDPGYYTTSVLGARRGGDRIALRKCPTRSRQAFPARENGAPLSHQRNRIPRRKVGEGGPGSLNECPLYRRLAQSWRQRFKSSWHIGRAPAHWHKHGVQERHGIRLALP